MSEIWDGVYSEDSSFFGEEPSIFANLCYEDFSKYGRTKIFELGCGQGRDTIFFANKGLDVHALDSSKVAIQNLNERARKENVSINLKNFDAKRGLPFDNTYFDIVYSHMFYNMNFTDDELKFLFSESSRVLKDNGLLYFSVRSDKDSLYNKGKQIDNNIYQINNFQIRFFTTQQIKYFLNHNFIISRIIEDYEVPANLYYVFATKNKRLT